MPSSKAQKRKNRQGSKSLSQMWLRLKYPSMLSWKGVYVFQAGEDLEMATA